MAMAQDTGTGLRLSILLASDYKLSGLSQTHSGAAMRIAADYQHASGFFTGGMLNNVEFVADGGTGRDRLANFYAGYQWRSNRWAGNVSASRYIYPGYSPRYDYSEIAASISYRRRYYLTYSRSDDYLSINQDAEVFRGGITLPWIREIEASVNAGEFSTHGAFNRRYSFWDIGLSRGLGRFALDLRYHDDTYDRASILGESGDDRWVLSISYAITPRAGTNSSR